METDAGRYPTAATRWSVAPPSLRPRRGGGPSGSAARAVALAAALAVCLPASAAAQATTGSVQGIVRDSVGQPLPASEVVARHLDTNFERRTTSTERGFYRISGLRAGPYEITVRNAFHHEQTRELSVGVGQSLNLDFTLASEAVEVEALVVEGERRAGWEETTTPEVATNITSEQISELPQSDRNFLNFSTLVPGVRSDGGSITSGGARKENINVFIDGASYKNDILQGGVAGQDASDGNPFPQNAVDGFRVITQQYKAEYQKATSAVVTATTKSGTNVWRGDAFGYFTDEGLAAQEFFSAEAGADQPEFSRWQAGASLGGPIIQDELFIFLSYEGNIQDRLTTVNIDASTPPAAIDDFADAPGVEVPDDLSTLSGTFPVPFRSHLF
ncbi:MAG: carboxypeptidase regulatory-like domain-containing protein, partial [Gemmatimonadota bacterium]